MNTIIAIAIGAVSGIVIFGWNMYLFGKIKLIEHMVQSLPNPEQLAKEILKVKLPLSELSPDMLHNGMMMGESSNVPEKDSKLKKSNYIG